MRKGSLSAVALLFVHTYVACRLFLYHVYVVCCNSQSGWANRGAICRDYRWEQYPARNHLIKHPQDNSLMTYRGHKVLTTLIRAYFSPMHTTAQRFIYAGSANGSVYIYGEAMHPHGQPHYNCIAILVWYSHHLVDSIKSFILMFIMT